MSCATECAPTKRNELGVQMDLESVVEAAPAYNNGNHDARLLYTIGLASCRAHYVKKERGTNMIAATAVRDFLKECS